MRLLPQRSTRTYTLFPCTTLVRSFGRCKCATEPVRLTILLAAHLVQPLHVEGQRLWRGPRVERAAREAALADQAVVHDDGAGGGHVDAEFGRNLDQIVDRKSVV